MNRRRFLTFLSSLPFLGWLVPKQEPMSNWVNTTFEYGKRPKVHRLTAGEKQREIMADKVEAWMRLCAETEARMPCPYCGPGKPCDVVPAARYWVCRKDQE